MIVLTVGTQFPFDRLVRAVDEAAGAGLIWDEVFAQVGRGGYRPRNFEWAETLDRADFEKRLGEARAVIAHAGIGTILEALAASKPLGVMPRLSKYGEVVNDHQVGTAARFAAKGHILVACDETEVAGMCARLERFVPVPREHDARRVIRTVQSFLEGVARR